MITASIGSPGPARCTATNPLSMNKPFEKKTFVVLYANLTASPEVDPSVSEYLQSYLGLCSPVVTLQDAFDFLIYLRFAFYAIIQISYPYPLYIDQAYPYRSVCQAFLTSNETLLAPVKYTLDLWFNATGQYTCLDYTNPIGNSFANTGATERSWNYMQCTYLSCMSDTAFAGGSSTGVSDMFFPYAFNQTQFQTGCNSQYRSGHGTPGLCLSNMEGGVWLAA